MRFALLNMATKKRIYKCNICGWEGNNPREVEYIEFGWLDAGTYVVCPECYTNKTISTEALIMNLEIYSYLE